MPATLDDIYRQRNALAVALAKVVLLHGGRAGRGFDSDPTKDWDSAWRNVVYVDVPGVGQVSWHLSPDDLHLLKDLPRYPGEWDGTSKGRDPTWPHLIPSIGETK